MCKLLYLALVSTLLWIYTAAEDIVVSTDGSTSTSSRREKKKKANRFCPARVCGENVTMTEVEKWECVGEMLISPSSELSPKHYIEHGITLQPYYCIISIHVVCQPFNLKVVYVSSLHSSLQRSFPYKFNTSNHPLTYMMSCICFT